MCHFTALGEKDYRHTDILAVRLPKSVERVGSATLQVDDDFFEFFERSKKKTIPLIAEVKGGRHEHKDRMKIIGYMKQIFGVYGDEYLFVEFARGCKEVNKESKKKYPLEKCFKYILTRLDSAQVLTTEAEGPTKFGSWAWSEEFLSDLLYLRSLGFLSLDDQH